MRTSLIAFAFLLVSIALVTSCNNQPVTTKQATSITKAKTNTTMDKEQLTTFGKKYSEAWCSQKAGSVAAFFSTDGSLKVNADAPAVGRAAITIVAQGFMTAFPDMIVAMDSIVTNPGGIVFHWTLTGTNTGVGGTGNKVSVSGFEIWQLGDDGLIQESIGSFDAAEYNRQLNQGVK